MEEIDGSSSISDAVRRPRSSVRRSYLLNRRAKQAAAATNDDDETTMTRKQTNVPQQLVVSVVDYIPEQDKTTSAARKHAYAHERKDTPTTCDSSAIDMDGWRDDDDDDDDDDKESSGFAVDETIIFSLSSPTKSAVATDWLLPMQLAEELDDDDDDEEEEDDSKKGDIINNEDWPTDEQGDMLVGIHQRRDAGKCDNNNNNEGDEKAFSIDRLYELERRIESKSIECKYPMVQGEEDRWKALSRRISIAKCRQHCLQSSDDTSVVKIDQEDGDGGDEKIMGGEGIRISDDVLIREYAKLLLRRSSNKYNKKDNMTMNAVTSASSQQQYFFATESEEHTRKTMTAATTNTTITCLPPIPATTATTCTITTTMTTPPRTKYTATLWIRRSMIIGIFVSIIVMIISYWLLVNAAVLESAPSSSCVVLNPIHYSIGIIFALQSFLSIGAIVISILTLSIVAK
jgi:hypothetical protein